MNEQQERGRRKPMRRYRIEETLTVVVAEVEATSKEEARRKVMAGEVEFNWNDDGQDVRRGGGIHVHFDGFVR